MSISAGNQSIQMETEEYNEENKIIEKATEKLHSVFSAIGFESTEVMSVDELVETIKLLLASKRKESLASINITVEGGNTIIKNNIDLIIFLTLETILYLLVNGDNNIHVSVSGAGEIRVNFKNEIIPDKEFTKKIVMLLIDKEGLKYKITDNKAEIISNN